MSGLSARAARAADVLTANALFIFAPYILIYVAAWGLNSPVESAVIVTRVVYGFIAPLAVLGLFRRARANPGPALFWAVLFLILLLPGVYLEYPGDPWEHFRRIYAWPGLERMREFHPAHKSSYFFAYSLFGWTGIEYRRTAMDLYSACMQLIVCFEIYRLSRSVRLSETVSLLQAFAYIALFGTSIFGIRYYALSSTPLAIAASLAAASHIIKWREGAVSKIPHAALLLFYAAVICVNHLQAIIFLGITASALVIHYSRPPGRVLLTAFLLASLALGVAVMRFVPEVLGESVRTYVTFAGNSAFWKRETRILSTLGLHGIAAMAAAVFLRRRYSVLAILTVAPIVWLLVPPLFLLVVFAVRDLGSVYRILYAVPTSLMFTVLLLECFGRMRERHAALLAGLAVAVLGFISASPNFGRLRFQLHRPEPMRSLEPLDTAAAWFADNRTFTNNCYIFTDGVTAFALGAQLSRDQWVERFAPQKLEPVGTAALDEMGRNKQERPACGILAADLARVPPAGETWVGNASGHWRGEYADLRWYVDEEFPKQTSRLPALGWKVTEVPPFYLYYELSDETPH